MKRSKHVAVLAVLLLAAACGRDAQPADQNAADAQPAAEQAAAPAPTGLDPCALLTAGEAQEIIGEPVAGPAPNKSNSRICEFTIGQDGMSGTFNFMTDTYTADEVVAQLQGANVATVDVPGIGERSFWAPQMGMTQLNTFQGGNHIILTMLYMGIDEARTKDIVQKLMTRVVSKL